MVEYLDRDGEYLWNSERRRGVVAKLKWHLCDSFGGHRLQKQLNTLLLAGKFDLVHTNNLAGVTIAPWISAHRLRVPIVHTLRDHWILHPNSTSTASSGLLEAIVVKLLRMRIHHHSRKVDALVGISDFILNCHLGQGLFSNSSVREVIGNPYGDYEITWTPRKLENSPCIRLGYLGQLSEVKGLRELIRCVRVTEDVTLKIGGTGALDFVESLKAESEPRKIDFLGWVDPSDFFASIDILCVPSQWDEPFGRVILEAFSFGVPVVATDKGGIKELVSDTINGYLFDFKNRGQFSDVLKRIANPDAYEKMSMEALRTAKNYSAQKIAQSYFSIYETVLSG